MELTTQQKQTLKAWIIANRASVFDQATTDALNAENNPLFRVYRTLVTWDEIMLNGMDWSRVDNLSNGSKYRIWEWLFKNSVNAINPSRPNIRAGINAAWVGTAQDLAVRAAVYAHCFRAATVAEKLLATGAGNAPNQQGDGPATMGWEGLLTLQNVVDCEAA